MMVLQIITGSAGMAEGGTKAAVWQQSSMKSLMMMSPKITAWCSGDSSRCGRDLNAPVSIADEIRVMEIRGNRAHPSRRRLMSDVRQGRPTAAKESAQIGFG